MLFVFFSCDKKNIPFKTFYENGQLKEEGYFINGIQNGLWKYYYENLTSWANENGVGMPFIPEYCTQAYHMFYIIMPTLNDRNRLINYLKEKNILSVFHYLPLHLSNMGEKYGYEKGDLPITEKVSDCLIRLPFFNELSKKDIKYIVSSVRKFACG